MPLKTHIIQLSLSNHSHTPNSGSHSSCGTLLGASHTPNNGIITIECIPVMKVEDAAFSAFSSDIKVFPVFVLKFITSLPRSPRCKTLSLQRTIAHKSLEPIAVNYNSDIPHRREAAPSLTSSGTSSKPKELFSSGKMGDAPLPQEHLLVILPFDEPVALINDIRESFPHIRVSYFRQQRETQVHGAVPKDLLNSATILCMLHYAPILEDIPNVKFVHIVSAGMDRYLSHPLLTDTEIDLTTTSGIHGPPTAEWVVMNWLVSSKMYDQTPNGKEAYWTHNQSLMDKWRIMWAKELVFWIWKYRTTKVLAIQFLSIPIS
ncbi:conserved hypothetical protein [Histoplasma capsulatum H143]|uniref:Uncharacterized protein n=1 Tax=Ajellomyces capsulatus (strain H143) TaxID=544712 RepID=C6H2D0_AJECH|nr:conserved hypothetical protein [Histoplasma capsulatum H143]